MSKTILDDLKSALREEYEKERGGTHVSDLIYCPRESIFRKLEPQALNDKELLFFSMGVGHHTVLQSLLKWFGKKHVKLEQKVSYKGVTGHIDALIHGIPVEFKTQRSKTHEMKDHYVQQLKCYMSIIGSNVGKLISIGLVNYDKPFEEFEIIMTDEEIKKQLDWIESEGKQFKEALDKKDWKLARPVKDTPMQWKCENCKFREKCFAYEDSKNTK